MKKKPYTENWGKDNWRVIEYEDMEYPRDIKNIWEIVNKTVIQIDDMNRLLFWDNDDKKHIIEYYSFYPSEIKMHKEEQDFVDSKLKD